MRLTILIDKFPRTPLNEMPADLERGDDGLPQDRTTLRGPRGQESKWPEEEADETIEPYPVTH
jgi:hypothetical protein